MRKNRDELGADVIKIAFAGRTTAEMVAEVGVPVVIAGGPRAENTDEIIGVAREAIAAGVRGLVLGGMSGEVPGRGDLGDGRACEYHARKTWEVRSVSK